MTWRALGAVLPRRLKDARLQLHYAAQLVSAPGTSILPTEKDHQHTNLAWDPALDVLAGRRVGKDALRAALVFESLELATLDGDLERASRPLAGSTMTRALAWLGDHIDEGELTLPQHEMPPHPLAQGAPFSDAGRDERAELAAWFANATSVIHDAVAEEEGASPVRAWPHHFDIASLIALDPSEAGEGARSIGVGFSPGDESYDQPYFYVSPWPRPAPERLPKLTQGARWHTLGWTGTVLLGDQLISERAERQPELVRQALGDAIRACRAVLAG